MYIPNATPTAFVTDSFVQRFQQRTLKTLARLWHKYLAAVECPGILEPPGYLRRRKHLRMKPQRRGRPSGDETTAICRGSGRRGAHHPRVWTEGRSGTKPRPQRPRGKLSFRQSDALCRLSHNQSVFSTGVWSRSIRAECCLPKVPRWETGHPERARRADGGL